MGCIVCVCVSGWVGSSVWLCVHCACVWVCARGWARCGCGSECLCARAVSACNARGCMSDQECVPLPNMRIKSFDIHFQFKKLKQKKSSFANPPNTPAPTHTSITQTKRSTTPHNTNQPQTTPLSQCYLSVNSSPSTTLTVDC